MLELTVKVLNINLPEGNRILDRCKPLYEYAWFIQRIKEYLARGMTRDEAIVQAVKDCEKEGILADFMREHGSEAVNMLFTQWNMDDALAVSREEGMEDGIEIGEEIALIKLVIRKISKGKEPAVIAEELDEDLEKVERIYAVVKNYGLDEDIERIYEVLHIEQ